jgi:hypothetical protein
VHLPRRLYVWRGAQCLTTLFEAGLRAGGQLVTYEGAAAPEVVQQGERARTRVRARARGRDRGEGPDSGFWLERGARCHVPDPPYHPPTRPPPPPGPRISQQTPGEEPEDLIEALNPASAATGAGSLSYAPSSQPGGWPGCGSQGGGSQDGGGQARGAGDGDGASPAAAGPGSARAGLPGPQQPQVQQQPPPPGGGPGWGSACCDADILVEQLSQQQLGPQSMPVQGARTAWACVGCAGPRVSTDVKSTVGLLCKPHAPQSKTPRPHPPSPVSLPSAAHCRPRQVSEVEEYSPEYETFYRALLKAGGADAAGAGRLTPRSSLLLLSRDDAAAGGGRPESPATVEGRSRKYRRSDSERWGLASASRLSGSGGGAAGAALRGGAGVGGSRGASDDGDGGACSGSLSDG